jgi:hypothetical protein
MPQHWQPVVAAGAVQSQADDLAGAAAGSHDGLPHVAQAAVAGVIHVRELSQVDVVGQSAGHLVGERAAGPRDDMAAVWHRRDDAAVQSDPVGLAGLQRAAQQLAPSAEQSAARRCGDQAALSFYVSFGDQHRQAQTFTTADLSGKLLQMEGLQHGRIVPALRACISRKPPNSMQNLRS